MQAKDFMSATPSADPNVLIHLLRQLDNLRFGELKRYDGSILETHGKDILIDLTRCLNHYMIRKKSLYFSYHYLIHNKKHNNDYKIQNI